MQHITVAIIEDIAIQKLHTKEKKPPTTKRINIFQNKLKYSDWLVKKVKIGETRRKNIENYCQ